MKKKLTVLLTTATAFILALPAMVFAAETVVNPTTILYVHQPKCPKSLLR